MSDVKRITNSVGACEHLLEVDVFSSPTAGNEISQHTVTLTNGAETVFGTTSHKVLSGGSIWVKLPVPLQGCIKPRWKTQEWTVSFVAKVKGQLTWFQPNVGWLSGIRTRDESGGLALFEAKPTRPKPAISVASIVPSTTTASLLVSSNSRFGDPEFSFEYKLTKPNSGSWESAWKPSRGPVIGIKGLKRKSTYQLQVRVKSFDGALSSILKKSFKTK
jgi:hypothetical protein